MKWKDLSLKERKQIYDSVRVNNPGATYFDIKEQFDSIPAYEDGGKSIVDEVNKEVNGKLIDFTRPPYNNRAAVENALKTGDYVDLPKFEDALWYTENYKRYYPRFEDGGKNKNVPVLPKE